METSIKLAREILLSHIKYELILRCKITSEDRLETLTSDVERGCFNAAAKYIYNEGRTNVVWDTRFESIYSIKCSTFLDNLKFKEFAEQVVNMSPTEINEICAMQSRDQYKGASEQINDEYNRRIGQKTKKNYVEGKKCIKCKSETVDYSQSQRSRADDGYLVTRFHCDSCGYSW